jgi:hypothetical protein
MVEEIPVGKNKLRRSHKVDFSPSLARLQDDGDGSWRQAGLDNDTSTGNVSNIQTPSSPLVDAVANLSACGADFKGADLRRWARRSGAPPVAILPLKVWIRGRESG